MSPATAIRHAREAIRRGLTAKVEVADAVEADYK
jgi:hypothetical protein